MQNEELTKPNTNAWFTTLNKWGIEGCLLLMILNMTKKKNKQTLQPTSYFMVRNLKLSHNKQKYCPLTPLTMAFHHHTGSPRHCNRVRKRNKRYADEKWIIKSVFFLSDDMVVPVENAKGVTKKLLGLLSNYSKVAEY